MLSLAASILFVLAADAPPTTSRPSGRAASKPARMGQFQPGVRIDWARMRVLVQARVVLREGPLEFFACFPGKQHESILLIEASAESVYRALGLIGIEPGAPARWDPREETWTRASGDLVDVFVQVDNKTPLPAFSWLKSIEYDTVPVAQPWVFAGSQRTNDGTLAAQLSGAGIALVDFSDSLLSLRGSHSSSDTALWVVVNQPRVPPKDAQVQLVLQAARVVERHFTVDPRGATFVGGRYVPLPTFVELVALQHRLTNETVRIENACRIRSVSDRLGQILTDAELTPADWQWVPATAVQ